MKTKTKKKYTIVTTDFDPVKMMRDIRDKLTEEILGMTYDQEKAYLKKLIAKGQCGALKLTAYWVVRAEEYLYSSAKNYAGKQGLVNVETIDRVWKTVQ